MSTSGEIRTLNAVQTRAALPMANCIEAMDRAMRALTRGRVSMPPRQFFPTGGDGEQLGVMPCVCADEHAAATKIISITPANADRGLATIQGFVSLFDTQTGQLRLIADGATITAIRTAAASALATRELARPDSTTLGILGTGVQAYSHLEAIRCLVDIRRRQVRGHVIRIAVERIALDPEDLGSLAPADGDESIRKHRGRGGRLDVGGFHLGMTELPAPHDWSRQAGEVAGSMDVELVDQPGPTVRGKANSKSLDGFFIDASRRQILPGDLGFRGIGQCPMK